MYPFFRLFTAMQKAKSAPTLQLYETCVIPMRVSLLDTDLFREMNNGRHLTLYDIGRLVFAVRTGLWREVRKRGWAFVVAGSSVRFRKRLHPWQRYEQRTRVLGYDDKWFYFEQSHWKEGECCSSALIRAAVVAKGKLVSVAQVLQVMQAEDWQPVLPTWVHAWIAADEQRPWPPE